MMLTPCHDGADEAPDADELALRARLAQTPQSIRELCQARVKERMRLAKVKQGVLL